MTKIRESRWKWPPSPYLLRRLTLEHPEQIGREPLELRPVGQRDDGPRALAQDLDHVGDGLEQVAEFGVAVVGHPGEGTKVCRLNSASVNSSLMVIY